MKERPILFSAPMVNATLEGRKTQTRRVIKPQPEEIIVGDMLQPGIYYRDADPDQQIHCPYGQPGDRLWVRETWAPFGDYVLFRADGEEYLSTCETPGGGYPENCRHHPGCEACTAEGTLIKWRPSIHMPRWASRITLKIKSIRVERVHDITEADAVAEGIETHLSGCWTQTGGYADTARLAFGALWDSINSKRGYGWNLNPWVWVIEFERIK